MGIYIMDKYINIVISADKNYLAIIMVLMTSIVMTMNPDETVRFFIFSQDFGQIEKNVLARFQTMYKCKIVNVPMEDYMYLFKDADLSTSPLGYLKIACYFRLLMFKILPDDVEKCFYVDGDIIVDTDLSRLFRWFPSDKLAAVCPEVSAMQYWQGTLWHCLQWPEFAPFQTNRYTAPYFNSGFYLLNVKKAKELNLFDAAFEFLNAHPNPPYPDQDTLNAIMGQQHPDKLVFLGPEWNVFPDMPTDIIYDDAWHPVESIQAAFANPLIYHYAGPNKPWVNRRCRNHWQVWWNYCEKSPCRAMRRPPIEQ